MADVVVNGTVEINALPDAVTPITGTEWLLVKQGTADRRISATKLLALHADRTDNPHQVRKQDLYQGGLGNVTDDAQLKIASNLDDLADVPTARVNLSVYSKAESDTKLKAHTDRTDNPHGVTARQLGLDNVPNWTASNDYKADTDTLASSHALSALYRAIQAEHPIGSIYFSTTETNPGTYLLCGGTWVKMAKGQTLVGYDDQRPSRAVGATFGVETVTLGTDNLPAHFHAVNITSGSHSHGVNGAVQSGGAHGHSVLGNTSNTDLGTKSGTAQSGGGHTHTGSTNATGSHQHRYRGDDMLPPGWGVAQLSTAVYDAFSDYNLAANDYWTSPAGDHSHTILLNSAGEHTHTVSVIMGSHQHNFSGTAAVSGDHTHNVNLTSDTSTVTISGNTQSVGGNRGFSVEQPSIVVNIWTRTA